MIKVTCYNPEKISWYNDKPHYIEVNSITLCTEYEKGGTLIYVGGQSIIVKETLDELMKIIEENKYIKRVDSMLTTLNKLEPEEK